MSEEKKTIEHTEVELQAMDKGWTDQTGWEGESELWVDAGEFIRRGELMDRISDQSRQLRTSQEEISALKEGITVLTSHNKTIAEQEYKKALTDLKAQKANAMDEGDNRKVVEIDERLDELKEARKELDSEPQKNEPTTQKNQQIDNRILEWQEDNTWYTSDVAMQGAADAHAMDYVRRNPHLEGNVDAVLGYVTTKMKEEFPERTGGTRRRPAGTVDSGSTGATKGRSTKAKAASLTGQQRKIAEKFVTSGVMTMDEYVAKLSEVDD